jgi:short subunit dehydrogenase-like uncharacterized protein
MNCGTDQFAVVKVSELGVIVASLVFVSDRFSTTVLVGALFKLIDRLSCEFGSDTVRVVLETLIAAADTTEVVIRIVGPFAVWYFPFTR